MKANQRVSFLLSGKKAHGIVVLDEAYDRCLVAVDPGYMQASQGILHITIWIPSVCLTVVL